MATLVFVHGVMGSGKTANLIDFVKTLQQREDIRVKVFKPTVDTRDDMIVSRNGERVKVSSWLSNEDCLNSEPFTRNTDVIIIDESQFLTLKQVEELRKIVDNKGIFVICYGLLDNFMREEFEASAKLKKIANHVVELHKLCPCGKKATISARFEGGKIVTEGDIVLIGNDKAYKALCPSCYARYMSER